MKRVAATVLALTASSLLLPSLPGQSSPPAGNVSPLEVELIRSINSETLQLNDDVLGKVRQDWTTGTCKLPAASVLHGKVVSLDRTAAGRDTVALDFRLRCIGGDLQEKLIWIALLAPEPVDDSNKVLTQSFHSSSFGRGNGMRPDGNEPVGGSGKPGVGGGGGRAPSNLDMSGRQNPSFPLFVETEDDRKARRPTSVKTGDVFQLPRLKLAVGAGPGDSTVLSSKDKRVKLPMGSILVLLPESAAIRTAAAVTPTEKIPSSKPAPQKLPPPIAPCSEPTCTVLDSMTAAGTTPAAPFKTISLEHLGYSRLKAAEMRGLEYSAAVAFLGEDHVLFTFDPHTLVPRNPDDRPEDHPHMVRAVLLNLASGKPERTLEWRVRGEAQYLWSVDGEHVLIHDGDRLRWFGANLHEERALALDGPLAFLRMSPDRKHYAVGVIQELHNPDEHAGLLHNDAAGPEERVKVQVLDANLKVEDEGTASSRAIPPILLDSGQVELRRSRDSFYYLREYGWTPGALAKDVSRLESACVPEVKSLSTDLLMAEGCDRNPNDHWLLILRGNGAPVLKSSIHWREFSPLTADTRDGQLFAMAICEGGGEYVRASPFHGKDLSRETVRVHRAGDGREVFSARMRFPMPSNQPIAFSPSGRRLAVVDGDQIDLYQLGASGQ